jgi:hypothetical protein
MEKIIDLDGNQFILSIKEYPNNSLIGDYPCIVFSLGEGNPCENWSLEMKSTLPTLCNEIINLICEDKPQKFCFFTKDDEIYQLYKSKELPFLNGSKLTYENLVYDVFEKELQIHSLKIRASFYDKVG